MKIIFSSLVTFFALHGTLAAETLRVVDDEWVWFSSNLEKADEASARKKDEAIGHQESSLENLSYDRYFALKGQPPPYAFLQLLGKDARSARIEGKHIVFSKSGLKLPLKTDLVPPGRERASPYLMETPDRRTVFAVYPYYFYGCKENDHIAELYAEDGSFLHRFDSLPTHAVKKHPRLLITPERSGCCDSLKWRIRFYDLVTGKESSYGCPEGGCGDLLFIDLERGGAFFLGLELVGSASGVGAFIQTHIYVINDRGLPVASGKIIHALRSSFINNSNIQDISPFSISKLDSAAPIAGNGGNTWRLEFRNEDETTHLVMNGTNNAAAPAVVFLESRNSGQGEIVEFDDQDIGALPAIVVCESGTHAIQGKMSKAMSRITVQSDTINRVIF